jgi:hypothetical protein
MQKLSKKQLIKHQTIQLMKELLKSLVDPEQANSITTESVMAQLGRKTHYKNQETGTIHLGLCYKQLRKMVKENPHVTVDQVKAVHNLG